MSTDYAEKEREFIASLEPDTGRDLAGWMDAITRADLAHRNDIIDWLRTKGFPFAKASWLERIHHNGGKLIYADDGPRRPSTPRRPREAGPRDTAPRVVDTSKTADPPRAVADAAPAPHAPRPRPVLVSITSPPPPRPAIPPAPPPAAPDTNPRLDALLAKAKAYRPLAQFVLDETRAAIPAVTFDPQPPQIVLSAPHEFAALVIGPKDLRLCLDCGLQPLNEVSRLAGSQVTTGRAKPFPHVLVLTDARQVTPGLIELLRDASARTGRS